jgi:tetratricopeptide (TPR) repeat protein
VRLALGEEDLALADFNLALQAEEAGSKRSSTFLRTVMGRHFYQKGNLDSADSYLDSALLVTPKDPLALSLKGQVARARGNTKMAKRYLREAIETSAEPLYLVTLSDILRREGYRKSAKKTLKEAEGLVRAEIRDTRYDHYNELSEILLLRNCPHEKAETIEVAQMNVDQRQNAESYFILARAHYNAKNYVEADAAISRAIATKGFDCRYGLLKKKIDLTIGGDTNPMIGDPSCPQAELDLNTRLRFGAGTRQRSDGSKVEGTLQPFKLR